MRTISGIDSHPHISYFPRREARGRCSVFLASRTFLLSVLGVGSGYYGTHSGDEAITTQSKTE